jgi:hypothetical protein
MDPQQRLRDLALERRHILYTEIVIDLDRLGEVEREIACLVLRVEQDRLVKTR